MTTIFLWGRLEVIAPQLLAVGAIAWTMESAPTVCLGMELVLIQHWIFRLCPTFH